MSERQLTLGQLAALAELLDDFEKTDLGDMPAYLEGRWSRSNLDAMIEDINSVIKAR